MGLDRRIYRWLRRLGMLSRMRAAGLSLRSQLSGGCLLLAPNGPDFIDAYSSLLVIEPTRRAFRGERFLGMLSRMRAAGLSLRSFALDRLVMEVLEPQAKASPQASPIGVPAEAQQSGFGGERRRKGVNGTFALSGGSGVHGLCADAGGVSCADGGVSLSRRLPQTFRRPGV